MLKKLKSILSIDVVPFVLGAIIFSSSLIMGLILADFAQHQLLDQFRYQLRTTAAYAALITDPKLHMDAQATTDRNSAAYETLVRPYTDILVTRNDIRGIYTLVPCKTGMCFVASVTLDYNHRETPMLQPYKLPSKTLMQAFANREAAQENTPYTDEAGHFISAYQPITDHQGKFIAMLGVDMNATLYLEKVAQIKKDLYFGLMISSLISMIVATAVYLMRRKITLSEQRYKSLVNNIPAVIFECRLDDHLTMSFLNNEIEALTGCTREQLLLNKEFTFISLIQEDEEGATLREIKRQLEQKNTFDMELRLVPRKSQSGQGKNRRAVVWTRVRGVKVGEDYDGCPIIEGYMRDITTRKAAEAKLIENQRYIKDLADSMPSLLWITNPYGDSVFYNKTWLNFTGRTLLQEIDSGWLASIHPEDKDAVMNKFLRALSTEQAFEAWFRILRSDGVYRWMLANCTPKLNTKGECDGFICVAADITERKIFENELKNANEQMEQVFLHAPASIAVFDKDLRYVLVSERWQKNSRTPEESLIGKQIHETCPSSSSMLQAAFKEALSGVHVSCPVEKYNDHSGEEKWIKTAVHPWLKDGQVNGVMVFVENVTDSYRVTEQIRRHRDNLQEMVNAQTKKLIEESEKNILLRTIIASANEAQDMDTALQSCVEEVCKFTGWDFGHCFIYDQDSASLISTDIISRSAKESYPDLIASIAHVNLSLELSKCLPAQAFSKNEAGWQVIEEIDIASPRSKAILNSTLKTTFAFPITVNGQPIGVFEFFSEKVSPPDENIMGLLDNIGIQFGRVIERFRHEEILTKAKEMAEASAKAKSEFLSNMSHELRTPMHAILNYASMSLKRVSHTMKDSSVSAADGKLEKYISNIQTAGNRLLELLNNLLDLAKMESGKMSYVFAENNIMDIVDRTCTELDSLLTAKNIEVDVNVANTLPKAIFDPQRLMQVSVNLFSNAIKFTPENSKLIVQLEAIHDQELGEAIHLSLTDQGPGIPKDEIDTIFEHFTQSSQTKSGAGGTGLGLTIAKQIIEAHGGRIWAENTELGARFNFIIPQDARSKSTEEAVSLSQVKQSA